MGKFHEAHGLYQKYFCDRDAKFAILVHYVMG